MRTTLSLEPDVAAMVERELAENKTTLKALINDKLRKGFASDSSRLKTKPLDFPKPMNLGTPLIGNFDNIAEILELMESGPKRR